MIRAGADRRLLDEYGLENTEPIAYRFEAVEDRLPAVTIMEPESDEPVLATAVVPLQAEARDDVAVAGVGAGLTWSSYLMRIEETQ